MGKRRDLKKARAHHEGGGFPALAQGHVPVVVPPVNAPMQAPAAQAPMAMVAPVPIPENTAEGPEEEGEWIQHEAFCPENVEWHNKALYYNPLTGESCWERPPLYRVACWAERAVYLQGNPSYHKEAEKHWVWRTYGLADGHWYNKLTSETKPGHTTPPMLPPET